MDENQPHFGEMTQTFVPEGGTRPEPAERDALTGAMLGTYRVVAQLGKGGMGEVYLAKDTVLERKVAIKVLPAEYTGDRNRIRRFEQEAKAASALNHPNIVSIFGFGESEFGQYMVMEWIEGQNLRLYKPWPMDAEALREIALQVAKALEVTHAAGLIHRDIKPDNIMVRHDGLVKVLDFGLSRLAGLAAEAAERATTVPGVVVGTLKYMSPEQARGEWLTAASDIFSLGIVFHELATGKHPFQAETPLASMHAIVSRQVTAPSRLHAAVPAWLDRLVLRMLEKDAAARCTAAEVAAALRDQNASTAVAAVKAAPARLTVGRQKERAELHSAFHLAADGRSSMLSISGEAGLGKTTLVEEFLAGLVNEDRAIVARGRCSERLAGAEAYLPAIEALESLTNGVEGEAVAEAMKRLAPTWYAQLVPSTAAMEAAGPPSPDKLKRELAALLRELSRQQPLVIFLDDVQWADLSTVDLLSYVMARLDGMRLLIIATYRAPEMHSSNQQLLALQLDLQSRGVCRELALGFFSTGDIADYLGLKYPGYRFPAEFADRIHQRTEGNPLFVADLLRYLEERQAIAMRDGRWTLTGPVEEMLKGVPESVRSMVQQKMEQLGEEERLLLTAASVQGPDFDAAVAARALDADPADVEDGLAKIERTTGFVKVVAEHEYPDRSVTLRYRFVHVLYQNAFFAALRPARRTALSRKVGEALLELHGKQAGKVAAQAAYLFETARDFEKAAQQYQIAARNALHLFASSEAENFTRHGLEAARSLPEDEARLRQELELLKLRAAALRNLKSHSGQEAIETHQRLLVLAEQLNEYYTVFAVRYGLAWGCTTHQLFDAAAEQAAHCLRIAEEHQNPCMLAGAHLLKGDILTHKGQLKECVPLLEAMPAKPDAALAPLYAALIGADPCAHARGLLGLALLLMGRLDQGRARLRESAELGRLMGNPIAHGVAMICNVLAFRLLRDREALGQAAEELTAICLKAELHASMMYFAKFGQGWKMALEGNASDGLAQIDEAIADAEAIGLMYGVPILAPGKAEAMRRLGRDREAVEFLDEQIASVEQHGQWIEAPELYRAKGLSLRGPASEEWLVRALETARRMDAKSLELMAASSLAELYRAQDRRKEAAHILSPVYGWFTEGLDTPPLQRAKALLEEIAG